MMLYTYENPHLIFPYNETGLHTQETIDIPGGQLLVEHDNELKSYRIVRLLATDPNMFLEQKYMPGQMIRY